MKKTLKLLGLCAILAASVVSCGPKGEVSSDSTSGTSEVESIVVPEGYTSLANGAENAPLTADGKYSYAGQSFSVKKELKSTYSTEMSNDKFNYLTNGWQYNSEQYTNMVDGLVENNKYGDIVGALAYAYKQDGKVWTLKIRKGVKWVNNKTGDVVAEVKADDFVAGIEYVLDPLSASQTAGVVSSQLAGAADYYKAKQKGQTADFSTVGVKAIDDYTLQFTTIEEMPYFLSCLTYSPYLPVNREYLDNSGTDFGSSENNILVNGAFRMTSHVQNNKIVFTKNDKYWDADHVYVDTVTKTFLDSSTSDSTTTRTLFENGEIDSFTVNKNDAVGWKKYVSGEDGTGKLTAPASDICNAVRSVGDATYVGYFNFVRPTSSNEVGAGVTAKTAAQQKASATALQNKDFRKGFLYGLKVMECLQYYGEERGIQLLARAYTNRELCSVNGKDYADYVADVFNERQGTTGVKLAGILDGYDPVYNAEKSKTFFAAAKAELIASSGLSEADFPIQIDTVVSLDAEYRAYQEAMYRALNAAGAGVINVRMNVPSDNDQNTKWMRTTFNYDFSLLSGWGPDYADPQTFLHTFIENGDMVEQLGFDGTNATAELQHKILGDYTTAYEKGAAITSATKIEDRYKAFAEAEYQLIYEDAIIVPWETASGYAPVVSNTVAHQSGTALYGLTADKLKNVVVTENAITKAQRTAIDEYFESQRGQ